MRLILLLAALSGCDSSWMGAATPPPRAQRDLGGEPVSVPDFAAQLGRCSQHAVFFAVSAYDDAAIDDLATPENDVTRLAGVLQDRYGFEPEIHRDPTRAEIVDRLYGLRRELKPCDALLVYYAGHGKRGFWVPSDGRLDSPSTWVSTDDVVRSLRDVASSQVLLVVDACFAGGTPWSNTRGLPESNTEEEIRKLRARSSRKVLMSGGDELVLDAYKEGYSVFAYFLALELEGLSDPYVTASTLLGRVAPRVTVNAQQTPVGGLLAGDEGGFFVLATKDRDPPPPSRPSVLHLKSGEALRWVSGGTFQMGSPEGEEGRDSDERLHEVTVDGLYVMETEVTQGLWQRHMGNNPAATAVAFWNGEEHGVCERSGDVSLVDPSYPVHCVTWHEAVVFANALSRSEGLKPAYRISGEKMSWERTADGFRLLTEAEWERAARGGLTGQRFAGTATDAGACAACTSESASPSRRSRRSISPKA